MTAKAKGTRLPRKPAVADIAPDQPAALALHRLLEAQHRELARLSDRLLANADPETVHDFRTALRRALGLYKIFRQHLDAGDRRMELRLKSLARALAPLRDWDVWMDLLRSPLLQDEIRRAPAGFVLLHDVNTVRDTMAHEAVRRLRRVLTPALRVRLRRPTRPPRAARIPMRIGELGLRELARMAHKVRKHPEDITHVDIDRMHDVRKALRRIRHLVDLLEPALPPVGRKLGRAARRGERPLGQVRDIDLALARLRARGDALARRLTRLLRRHRAERLAKGQKAWRRFQRKAWSRRLSGPTS